MTKRIGFILLIIGLISCSEINNEKEKPCPNKSTAFKQVTSEIELLLPLIKNNNLILDSSAINSYESSYALVKDNKAYRSEQNFDGIILKRIFNTKNDTISSVHFDFYYDSSNTYLKKDVDTLLNYFVDNLGGFEATFNETMTTHSWNINNSIFDFEVFKNGYTLTVRSDKKSIKPVVLEEKIAEHFLLSEKLINYILGDSLKLNETTKDNIKSLFPFDLLEKKNALAFNKTYNKHILLSASFIFKKEKLMGIYFDYMYNDTETDIIISDSKIIKQLIIQSFNTPSEVATVELSTYYSWGKKPIGLEIYSDGFSVIFEAKKEL